MKVKVTQLCPAFCDPMNSTVRGILQARILEWVAFTVHGILQATILEWVAFPFFKESSQPRVEHRSPTLQVDSLPAETQGKTIYISEIVCNFLFH